MPRTRHWTLGAKLALVATPFLLLALVSIALTLWVSWQLEGGAAAVNEAGRMRMQAYRLSLSVATADASAQALQVKEFEQSLALLRHGDPERPLFVPWDDNVRKRFSAIEQDWQRFRDRWVGTTDPQVTGLRADTAAFSDHIDAVVVGIETHMSRWTAFLHLLQVAVMTLSLAGAAALIVTGYRFVLEPLGHLKDAIERIQKGDFTARVQSLSSDEFGTLATGFNDLAEHLQSMYRNLETKVVEKTAELHEKRERLEALYDVTTLMANASSLEEMATRFSERVARVAHADGVAVRWADETNQRYLLLASQGLPASMADGEQCLIAGDCHCGAPDAPPGVRIIPIEAVHNAALRNCAQAGFQTVVSVPIRLHERTLGEVDLFFHADITQSQAERSLLEALTAHLASAMENMRLDGLAKEAAVSQERNFLARELHDSIAQSLAFLKMQVQLLRDAQARGDAKRAEDALAEIDAGVRESYGDVRELLVHFRTRANAEDMKPALETTLRKFQHQSGLEARLQMQGQGLPLSPEVQIQVLHIVQEALSNVRKHANATRVWLDVAQQPQWRFEVRDNGVGFAPDDDAGAAASEHHLGLRIMGERAERIGALLQVHTTAGRGTSVVLEMAAPPPPLQAANAHAKTDSAALQAAPAANPTSTPTSNPTRNAAGTTGTALPGAVHTRTIH